MALFRPDHAWSFVTVANHDFTGHKVIVIGLLLGISFERQTPYNIDQRHENLISLLGVQNCSSENIPPHWMPKIVCQSHLHLEGKFWMVST